MPSCEILSLDARSCKPFRQIFRGDVSRYRGNRLGYTLMTARRETRRFSPPDIRLVNCTARLLGTCMRRERERERDEVGYALFITAVMSWVTCGGNCPRRSSTVFCRESRMPRSTPLSRSARTTSILPQSAASCIAVPADVLVFTSTPAASNTSTTALKPTGVFSFFAYFVLFFLFGLNYGQMLFFFFVDGRENVKLFLDETGEKYIYIRLTFVSNESEWNFLRHVFSRFLSVW